MKSQIWWPPRLGLVSTCLGSLPGWCFAKQEKWQQPAGSVPGTEGLVPKVVPAG